MKVKFEIIGPPQGKGRHRAQVLPNGKIHTYTPENTASYENLVKVMYLQQVGRKRLTGALQARIQAFYAIPNSWSKKRKAEANDGVERPKTKPDLDNCCKIILDALNGIAFYDDKQVVELYASKHYADIARVEVTLTEIKTP